MAGNLDPFHLPTLFPAERFALRAPSGPSGSALRSPTSSPGCRVGGTARRAPGSVARSPPPMVPMRRGLTATVPGLGDPGLSPALPELQARRHLVVVPGFRSGKCESD